MFDVTHIYQGVRRILIEQYHTIYAKEQAPHAGTRGGVYEQLLKELLIEYLPQRFYWGSGQVISSIHALGTDNEPKFISKQMDIVAFDAFNHPILLPTAVLK